MDSLEKRLEMASVSTGPAGLKSLYSEAQQEIERLRAMVQDEARWQSVAASYRDERDTLRAALMKIRDGGMKACREWEIARAALSISEAPSDEG